MIDTIVNSFDIWTDAQGIKSRTRVKSVDNISLEGIASLRALIIELALQGKLIPQDSTNEPANLLLERIKKEKEKLIGEGKIPKQKSLKEIEQTKMPYSLPNGWKWAWFSDSYFFQEGPGIRNWQFRTSGIKLLNVQNIVGDKLILDNTDKHIDIEEYQQKYQHFTIEENDLVFASSGGSWGKSAFFNDPGYRVIVNTSTIRMHPFLEDCPRNYLKLFLDSKLFKNQMIEQLVGIQPNFGSTHLFKILIPVPPSKEQYLIASKVDELMTLCDKLEKEQFKNLKTHQALVKTLLETLTQAADANELQASWERISEHFDILFCTEDSIEQLKQTILQLAVMGKLVKQDPNEEPACELIKKIAKEKERLVKEGKIKKQSPLPEINENEKAFILPSGWEWKRLNDIIDVRDGTHDSPKEAFDNITYPLVTSQNFENGKINFDTAKRISEADHFEISKRSFVERYDILFSMIGGNLGNQVMVNTDELFSIKNVALFKYYSKDCTYPFFIKKIMEYIALTLQSRAIGGAQPFVSLGFLRNIVIALPPVSEQIRIVNKIDELFLLSESLKEKVQKSQEIKVLLSKTIIEKAVE